MRLLSRVLLAASLTLSVASLGACSESSPGGDPAGGEAEVKKAEKDTLGGLLLGTYVQTPPVAVGQLVSLELKARTPSMPKKFLGRFARVDKTASGDKKVDGFFTVQTKTLKSKSTVSGTVRLPVMTFFDEQGKKIDELVAIRFDPDIVMSKPGVEDDEFFMTMDKDAKGNKAVSISLSCEVTDVNQSVNPFEEGLVAKGDGDEDSQNVRIEDFFGKFDLGIGQMSFSQKDGDDIKVIKRNGGDIELLVDISGGDKIRLSVVNKKGTMTIENGSSKKDLGKFSCK